MPGSTFYFDLYELDLKSYELRKSGSLVKLEKLPTELLILLAENRGELVSREQIIQRLWGDNVFVDTRQGINTAIRKIRVVLHDDPENPRLLQTVAGRGYRLLAPVRTVPESRSEVAASPVPVEHSSVVPVTRLGKAGSLHPFRGWIILAVLATVGFAGYWLFHWEQAHLVSELSITFNPPEVPVKGAEISPDGKLMAYADPTGLFVRDIASGETRPIAMPSGFFVIPSSWFPGGTHLLVTHFEGANQTPSLWNIGILGGAPRKVLDNAAFGKVSPDGSRIAYLSGAVFRSELWLMNSDGSNPKKLAESEEPNNAVSASRISSIAWSPTSERIAYTESRASTAPDPAEGMFYLQTLSLRDDDLQVVLNNTTVASALAWAPDGRIFYSSREDPDSERSDQGVRSIPVSPRSGKASGPIRVITHGRGRVGGLSIASNGKRLALWRVNTQPQLFIADFHAATHTLGIPRRLTLDANGNSATAWTPDSQAVLFNSNRNGTWKLYKQTVDQATAESLVEGRSIFLPRLSADQSQILYLVEPEGSDPSHPTKLMRLPLSGGASQMVLQAPGITNFQCARLPSTLCLVSIQDRSNHDFFSFDMNHGLGREFMTTTNGFENWTLSPDGSRLALFLDDHWIRFVAMDSGSFRDVVVKDWRIFAGDWSADSHSIFSSSWTSQGNPAFVQVNDKGHVDVLLEGKKNVGYRWMIPSPDGHHVMLLIDVPGENNAWMIDNP